MPYIEDAESRRSIAELTQRVIAFRDAREWSQFHNARDNALSILIEASEFCEVVRWTPEEQVDRDRGGEELADVLYWVLLTAHDLDIDLAAAFDRKMTENEAKYPVNLSKGRSVKYDKL